MRTRVLTMTTVLALSLAACGGDGEETTTDDAPVAAEAGAVTVTGDDTIKWTSGDVEAELVDGSLDLTLVCGGAAPHNVVLEGVQGDEVLAECSGDDEATVTVDLEPGTYTYYCAIPGHRDAGMEAELTVS